MGNAKLESLCFIETIKDKCKLCYTCILRCPSKAIRIAKQQAEVIKERCIGCGNCVRNCSQGAKRIIETKEQVLKILSSGERVAACVAPSFISEFCDSYDVPQVVGAIRELGFNLVAEVAFGADLVSNRYYTLVKAEHPGYYIASTCPAVVGYVERYAPELTDYLAPIVSPMIATSRALKRIYSTNLKIVFIGPCVAKKAESRDEILQGEIDEVITFKELRELFELKGIDIAQAQASEFDHPLGAAGAIYPINRGILYSAGIHEDLLGGTIISTDGTENLATAIDAFSRGEIEAHLLEILSCKGCVMGPGMTVGESQFLRSTRLREYVTKKLSSFNYAQWKRQIDELADLDLSRTFIKKDLRLTEPSEQEITAILRELGKLKPEDELNCGACGYMTCREHAIAIHKGIAEVEMCLPNTIEKLQKTIKDLSEAQSQLANVQDALMQSERLASMGQLAAGIAHELNNPLGVVLMYSNLLLEQAHKEEEKEDLQTIIQEAQRCKKIVSGLLNFTRRNKVSAKPVKLMELIDNLIKVQQLPESIKVEIKHTNPDLIVELDPDQIVQVLTNLVTNAVAAMHNAGTLSIETGNTENEAWIRITDTGCGIPKEHMKKLFSPFFTTKKMGQGTGLGLAVSYGIVKMHRGRIEVTSNADPCSGPTGTTFTITLPLKALPVEEEISSETTASCL